MSMGTLMDNTTSTHKTNKMDTTAAEVVFFMVLYDGPMADLRKMGNELIILVKDFRLINFVLHINLPDYVTKKRSSKTK